MKTKTDTKVNREKIEQSSKAKVLSDVQKKEDEQSAYLKKLLEYYRQSETLLC